MTYPVGQSSTVLCLVCKISGTLERKRKETWPSQHLCYGQGVTHGQFLNVYCKVFVDYFFTCILSWFYSLKKEWPTHDDACMYLQFYIGKIKW